VKLVHHQHKVTVRYLLIIYLIHLKNNMSQLIHEAIIAIIHDAIYDELYDIYLKTINHTWFCMQTKDYFIEMILSVYQNPDSSLCYLAGLRVLRDNYQYLEQYTKTVHKIIKKRLLLNYNHDSIGNLFNLPVELLSIIAFKV